jgi:hypothetical protein
MLRIICTIAIIIAFVEGAQSQQPVEDDPPPACVYTELYQKDGWAIPGIKGAKKKWRTAVPDEWEVYITELAPPTRASTIQSFRCSREDAGRLEIEDLNMGILSLSSFDVGGRIFAYTLIYGVDGIATEWSVRFYDLDGSGRFRLRRSERNRFVPDLIPDWVRNAAGAETKHDESQVARRK